MHPAPRKLFLLVFLLLSITSMQAQQPVQMASLRTDQQLHWQRISPTSQKPEGPVLYQLVFTPGTPGTIAKFDTNPRHLTNSDITDVGGIVAIGPMSVNAGTG